MRAQSAKSRLYYREASRFYGITCKHSGSSVRADLVEAQISELMRSLVLPENWQSALQEILNMKKDTIDPQKEKVQINSEIRRMREAFKRGLYENDEHVFWREVENLQSKLDLLEQQTPYAIRDASFILANLQEAWQIASPEEKQQLCRIILKHALYDFETKRIIYIRPNAEYSILFQMLPGLHELKDGIYEI